MFTTMTFTNTSSVILNSLSCTSMLRFIWQTIINSWKQTPNNNRKIYSPSFPFTGSSSSSRVLSFSRAKVMKTMIYGFNILILNFREAISKWQDRVFRIHGKGKTFQIKCLSPRTSKQAPRVSSATLESSNRVITGIINNARLLNCLFKVYVFMVCRTWWPGCRVWVKSECTWFVFISESFGYFMMLCASDSGMLLFERRFARRRRQKYDSFNYYFQKQPHEDGSKAEMKPAQRKGLNV